MRIVILVFVLIAALFAVVSGVWVAIALITAISTNRNTSDAPSEVVEQGGD